METDTNNDVFSATTKNDLPITQPVSEPVPKPVQSIDPIAPKSKFEFNGISIVLCIVVIILIAIIVYLIVKKPKINNELLTKTQEMYKEASKKNKELSQTLEEVNKKNKVLESTNENIMKNNSALKDQLTDAQNRYSDAQTELNSYKSREAQELEVKSLGKAKSRKEKFQEQYQMINKPKDVAPEVEETLPEESVLEMGNMTGIAARQEAVKQQMNGVIEQPSADLESVMATLNTN